MKGTVDLTEKAAAALTALHEVPDPETGLNVVDMGLIYELEVAEDAKKIFALMTLSTQYCPVGQSIIDAVTNRLQLTFPDYYVQVTLTFDPPWRPEMISKEGHSFFNR